MKQYLIPVKCYYKRQIRKADVLLRVYCYFLLCYLCFLLEESFDFKKNGIA